MVKILKLLIVGTTLMFLSQGALSREAGPVAFQPPEGWSVEEDAGYVRMKPPIKSRALLSVKVQEKTSKVPDLRKKALSNLEAQNRVMTDERRDKQGRFTRWSYTSRPKSGSSPVMSCVYLLAPSVTVAITLTGTAEDVKTWTPAIESLRDSVQLTK